MPSPAQSSAKAALIFKYRTVAASFVFLTVVGLSLPAWSAADTQPTASPTSSPATTRSSTAPSTEETATAARTFSLTEYAGQAESTAAELDNIDRRVKNRQRVDNVEAELPGLTQEVSARQSETANLVTPSASIDILRTLDRAWSTLHAQLSIWQGDLKDRAEDLKDAQSRLDSLATTWKINLDTLRQSNAERPTIQRAEQVLAQIKRTQDTVTAQQASTQQLFNRVNLQDVYVNDSIQAIRRAQDRAFSRLSYQDSPAIWNAFGRSSWGKQGNDLKQQSFESLGSQYDSLNGYLRRALPSLLIHLAMVFTICALLIWLRPFVNTQTQTDPRAKKAAVIFELPLLTAFVVSMIGTFYIYPDAPRLFWGILGGVALLPIGFVLRSMVDRPLRPLLYGVIVFSFLGILQTVMAALPLLSRLMYLVEMGGAAGFTVSYLWHHTYRHNKIARAEAVAAATAAASDDLSPSVSPAPAAPEPFVNKELIIHRGLALALRGAALITIISAVANILGYVALAKLLAGALLTSAYLAMLLHASVVAADTLFLGAMNLRPLNMLGMVRHRGPTIRTWVYRGLMLGAAAFWLSYTLDALAVLRPISTFVWSAMDAQWNPGPLRLSLGRVIAFAVTVFGAFVLSRFVKFLLEEDVYPRVHLGRGIPYAITTILHYAILLIGFLAAISTVYELTQFTILASAFGVGLGFGMQNIVNNFVSGLILLFERPVQVGDVIEIAGNTATVTRIGIRASVVSTTDSAEIIIPNGQLISDRVINWTLTNRQRGLEIAITTLRSNDPDKVMALLLSVAKSLPGVAGRPMPVSVITAMNANTFTYQLRCFTSVFEDWDLVRSNLLKAINIAFQKEGFILANPG